MIPSMDGNVLAKNYLNRKIQRQLLVRGHMAMIGKMMKMGDVNGFISI
jgi:hypothetical protein